MCNNSVGSLSFSASSSSSSVSLSPNQSADIPPYSIPIETAIKILCQNYENCTEDILLQNFNMLCTLPNAIAKYEKPLPAKSVSRILSNVCLWDNGQKILKEMVLILKDKKVLLGCCDKPDNYGLNKNLLSLSVELFQDQELKNKTKDNEFLLILNLADFDKHILNENPNTFSRFCALMNKEGKIEIKQLNPKDLLKSEDLPELLNEGLMVSHEFYHVCSFCKKIDISLPNEIKEKHDQELSLFYPLGLDTKNFNAATQLFHNGEEMRNLCGLKIENESIEESIGEFNFWQEALANNVTS